MTTIAGTPAALTPDWFAGILGTRVADVELKPIGTGLVARAVRATLRGSDGPSSLVVKYPSEDPGTRGMAMAMGLYEREVRFYQDIAPSIGRYVPRCFHAESDPTSGEFVLVLEDLAGFEPGDSTSAAGVAQCALGIEALSALQIATWNSTSVATLPWLRLEAAQLLYDRLAPERDPFLERFGRGLSDEQVATIDALTRIGSRWVRSWSTPLVVQHGDFRSDNLMFGRGDAIMVIDFQTVGLAPPGLDIGYYLASSLSADDRRAQERALVAEWHARLVAGGIAGFSADDAWTAYRQGVLYPIAMLVAMGSQVEKTERGEQIVTTQLRAALDTAIEVEAIAATGLS